MAQIDLKFAKIFIRDGSSKAGAVNKPAGYAAGTLTIAIDGYTGIVTTGSTFTIAAETGSPTHTVTAHTEVSGNTRSVTFTTAIATGGVADNAVVTFAAKTGAIDNGAGYTGVLTINVDAIVGIITIGDIFTITGESGSPVHTVTAHTETAGNTTSLTFTGALVGTIADNTVITFAAKAGAVNQAGGYAVGVGTFLIDGITGEIPVGARFTVTGETATPIHTVTAHSETGDNTTSITFTPITVSTAADNIVLTFLPNQLEVNVGEGNLTYNEKVERKYVRNRGRLSNVMDGDEQPLEVSLNFIWDFLTGSTGELPTVEDCFKHRGEAASWTTAGADPCEPFALDLVVQYTPPCADVEMEEITLSEFRYEELDHNFKDAQVSVKGKCNVTEADAVRMTNTYPN